MRADDVQWMQKRLKSEMVLKVTHIDMKKEKGLKTT